MARAEGEGRAEGKGRSSRNTTGAGKSEAVSMVTMLHAERMLTILSIAPDESKLQIIIVLTHGEYFYKTFLLFLRKIFIKNSVHGALRNNKLWNQSKSFERQFWHMDLCACVRIILGDPNIVIFNYG